MSKVALSGNASGTGTFTIASPNSNTDRTLTLPDATGTVQVSGQPLTATTGSFSGNVTLGSSVLATPTGSAPSYTCRAWVSFEGSSPIIRASGNVSSITRSGTGIYTVNFSTAMPDSNFFVGTGPVAIGSGVGSLEWGGNTTTSTSMTTRYSAGGAYDWSNVFINIFR